MDLMYKCKACGWYTMRYVKSKHDHRGMIRKYECTKCGNMKTEYAEK